VQRNSDVVVEKDEEGYYIASVPALPGCHTQARSLDELDRRIREAIELCLEVEGVPEPPFPSPWGRQTHGGAGALRRNHRARPVQQDPA
jgi:predicted RNase H-like HicB family nuclease